MLIQDLPPSSKIVAIKISKDEFERRLQNAERAITKLAQNYNFIIGDLLDEEIVRFRTGITDEEKSKSCLDAVFTTAHDIRGLAASYGYDLLGQIASSLADFIEDHEVISQPKELQIIELHLHSMMLIAKNRMTGDGGDQGKTLLPQLNAAIGAVSNT